MKLILGQKIRLVMLASLVLVPTLVSAGFVWRQNVTADVVQQSTDERQGHFAKILPAYEQLNQKIVAYEDEGVDISEAIKQRDAIRALILNNEYAKAETEIAAALALLEKLLADKKLSDQQKAEELERQKGIVKGKIKEGSNVVASVTVTLLSGSTSVATTTSDRNGDYSITVAGGTYTLSASRSGYVTHRQTNLAITAQQTITHDITLSKVVATPTPQPNTSGNTTYSQYEQKSVSTSRGTFTVNMLTVQLGPGKARLITDVAADNDCSNNCPTMSLQNYVNRFGGFGGINGTYFCPTDYAECAGKTNTFYWKIFVTRLSKIINENNGLGDRDPVIIYTTSGTPRYYSRWHDFITSGTSVTAAISSRPELVNGGRNILNTNDLDDKQRNTKSNRGALGLKGNTMYAVVAKSATVIDLAEIMVSLGVDSAMNIDGGGSSALYYKGSYKVGPGRALPNAVIFAE